MARAAAAAAVRVNGARLHVEKWKHITPEVGIFYLVLPFTLVFENFSFFFPFSFLINTNKQRGRQAFINQYQLPINSTQIRRI
jgi:hypothetical protein